MEKRSLGDLIEGLKENDVLIVPELSRLGWSISMVYEIVETCQNEGVEIHALKQHLVIKDKNDMTTKMMLNTFSLAAELERDFIAIRTKEALAVRTSQGFRFGRPQGVGKSKLDAYADEIHAFKNNDATLTWIAKKYNTTFQFFLA